MKKRVKKVRTKRPKIKGFREITVGENKFREPMQLHDSFDDDTSSQNVSLEDSRPAPTRERNIEVSTSAISQQRRSESEREFRYTSATSQTEDNSNKYKLGEELKFSQSSDSRGFGAPINSSIRGTPISRNNSLQDTRVGGHDDINQRDENYTTDSQHQRKKKHVGPWN